MDIFYSRGKWHEAKDIRGGAVPMCDVGEQTEPKPGDVVIRGLSDNSWLKDLNHRGLDRGQNGIAAMDPRWTSQTIAAAP